MVDGIVTPYRELAGVLVNLGFLVREARRARGLSIRSAAKDIGVNFSTLSRVEKGDNCQADNYVAILRWLDQTPEPSARPLPTAQELLANWPDNAQEGTQ